MADETELQRAMDYLAKATASGAPGNPTVDAIRSVLAEVERLRREGSMEVEKIIKELRESNHKLSVGLVEYYQASEAKIKALLAEIERLRAIEALWEYAVRNAQWCGLVCGSIGINVDLWTVRGADGRNGTGTFVEAVQAAVKVAGGEHGT